MLSPRTRSPPRARPSEEARGATSPAPTDRASSWLLAAAVILPLELTAMSAGLSWQSAWAEAQAATARMADAGAEFARRLLDGMVLRLDVAEALLAGLSDAE